MQINFILNDKGQPALKLADVELLFTDGPLAGLKMVGFAVFLRSTHGAARYVAFPSRTYSVNGDRRSFALLRPADSQAGIDAREELETKILKAYDRHVAALDKAQQAANV